MEDALDVLGLGVDAGAGGRGSDVELLERGRGVAYALEGDVDRGRIARELLPEPDRHRVLEMSASRLHDGVELARLGRERVAQPLERAE
jgi:hypothetical protein